MKKLVLAILLFAGSPSIAAALMTLLKDESGANAVKYAVIMALVADFIISAVILMATGADDLFNAMAR